MESQLAPLARPRYTDATAAATLTQLARDNPKPGSLSGQEMTDAIIRATQDPDNQAAGREYQDLAKFVRENEQVLSPEAKRAFQVYQRYAQTAQGRGQTGITMPDFMRMQSEMRLVSGPQYQDRGAAATLTALGKDNPKPGSISGQEMSDAILRASRDPDNQAAGKEFADVAKFVRENEQLLSPEAKRAFAVYERFANEAKAKGQTGIDLGSYGKMQVELARTSRPDFRDSSAAGAIKDLLAANKTPGSVSGERYASSHETPGTMSAKR